jgi:hypothetical protein
MRGALPAGAAGVNVLLLRCRKLRVLRLLQCTGPWGERLVDGLAQVRRSCCCCCCCCLDLPVVLADNLSVHARLLLARWLAGWLAGWLAAGDR